MRTINRVLIACLMLLLLILLLAFIIHLNMSEHPSDKVIEEAVKARIFGMDEQVREGLKKDMMRYNGTKSSLEEIMQVYNKLYPLQLTASSRNSFAFHDGRKHSGTFQAEFTEPPFGINENRAYLFGRQQKSDGGLKYALMNTQPVSYRVNNKHRAHDNRYEVEISYTQPLRYAEVTNHMDTLSGNGYHNVNLSGLRPVETFVFERTEKVWKLIDIH